MNLTTIYGAALLLALLIASPALDFMRHAWGVWKPKRGPLRLVLWDLVHSELGAVNTLYYARGGPGILINGSATPPTAVQGSFLNEIKASCVFGVVADAQVLITHNMGLDVSAPTYLEPQVFMEPQSTTTYWPLITFDRTNTNVLKVNKPSTDAATTILVTIRRGSPTDIA